MMFAGSWDPSVFDSQFPAKCDWDVAMPPLDTGHAGRGALNMEQGWCWGISAKTHNINESVKVWKFLYSEDFLGELYRNSCVFPIVSGIRNNPKNKPVLKNFEKFYPTESESAYPQTPVSVDIDEGLRWDYYMDAFTGKKSIDESLNEGNRYLNTLLEQAVKKGEINIDDYINPGFDPNHPMEKY